MEYQRVTQTAHEEIMSSDFDDSDAVMASESQINLLREQTDVLKEIFSFGQSENEDDEDDTMIAVGNNQKMPRTLFTFKALLYDNHAQNLIAPLMNKGSLIECNIIQFANLSAKREPIADLPVIYLVEPTIENYRLIAKDAKDKLYDMMLVQFTKPTTTLSQFADIMQATKQAHRVISVQADYVGSFYSIAPSFFQWSSHDPSVPVFTEGRLANSVYLDTLAHNMFMFYQSIGLGAPIMRVSGDFLTKLSNRLTQVYTGQQVSSNRHALLVPLTRQDDLKTPFYHSWAYLSLIKDIFNVQCNAFTHRESEKAPLENFELDFKSDQILIENALKGFNEVGANVDKELNLWKTEYELINAKKSNIQDFSTQLTSAIDSVPQMQEKKRKIDMHVKVATWVLQQIQKRELDRLQDFEDELMNGKVTNQTRQGIVAYLQNASEKNLNDVTRLLAILVQSSSDQKFVQQCISYVQPQPGVSVLSDQQRLLIEKLQQKTAQLRQLQQGDNSQKGLFSVMGRSLMQSLFSQDQKLTLVNQVKDVVQTISRKISLSSQSAQAQAGSYYINCATGQKSQTIASLPQIVVAFTVGGGTFVDYELMQQLNADLNRHHKLQIIYGCDRVLSPTEFLEHMYKSL